MSIGTIRWSTRTRIATTRTIDTSMRSRGMDESHMSIRTSMQRYRTSTRITPMCTISTRTWRSWHEQPKTGGMASHASAALCRAARTSPTRSHACRISASYLFWL